MAYRNKSSYRGTRQRRGDRSLRKSGRRSYNRQRDVRIVIEQPQAQPNAFDMSQGRLQIASAARKTVF